MLFVWVISCSILAAVFSIAYLYYGRLWMRSHINQSPISLGRIMGMSLRGIKAHIVVYEYIRARKAEIDVSLEDVESHYQAGGDVAQVVRALISAQRDGRDVPFQEACAIDLQGKDVLKEIGSAIVPIDKNRHSS